MGPLAVPSRNGGQKASSLVPLHTRVLTHHGGPTFMTSSHLTASPPPHVITQGFHTDTQSITGSTAHTAFFTRALGGLSAQGYTWRPAEIIQTMSCSPHATILQHQEPCTEDSVRNFPKRMTASLHDTHGNHLPVLRGCRWGLIRPAAKPGNQAPQNG